MKKEEKSNEVSNFSIDHILNRAGQNTCTTISRRQDTNADKYFTNIQKDLQDIGVETQWRRVYEAEDHNIVHQHIDSTVCQQYTFQWLNCTRYQPPRLQRVSKKECVKRRPGRHPRIPFTPVQLEILESSYKNCPYLNSDEVTRLSGILDLADARIKIWFQNRRAREKREKPEISSEDDSVNIIQMA